jgi:hypothetical protein
MTEYQRMFYTDIASRIKWHAQENDITIIEVIGLLDMIKGECLDEAFMNEYYVEEDDEDSII